VCSGERRKEEHSDTHDLRQSGIRAGIWNSLCLGNRGEQKTTCRHEGNGSHLIVRIGMPEEGVDQQGMLRWNVRYEISG
jgi:hypothetical protein